MSDALHVMLNGGLGLSQNVKSQISKYSGSDVIYDLLNGAFDYQWSWEIIHFYEDKDSVTCHGRLTIPGIGIKDGIGSAKTEDVLTSYNSAASSALKNAAETVGITFGQQAVKPEPQEPVSTVQTEKLVPTTPTEKAKELTAVYNIASKSQFVAFAQIWNPNITEYSQLTPQDFEDLHSYAENNSHYFESYVATNR